MSTLTSVDGYQRAKSFDELFAANLRARREELGLSRPQLEARTGLSTYALREIECGRYTRHPRRKVTIGEAVVLAEALGVQPGELLKGPTQ